MVSSCNKQVRYYNCNYRKSIMANKDELKEYLDKILIEVAKSQNLQNYQVHPNVDEEYGDGFLSVFFTGEVKNKDTGEVINVAVKRVSPQDMEYWEHEGIFKNENAFYSKIFPALVSLQKERGISKPFDNVPKYFCGSLVPKEQFIAMENLKSYDYVMFDKKQHIDKEHLEFIFKTYGKFHATSYVLRNKSSKKYQEVLKEISDVFPQASNFITDQMAHAVSATVKFLDTEDEVYKIGQYLAENTRDIFVKACEYHGDLKWIVHGDCWSNNMLFKYSESGKLLDLKLIDFQLCRESTPIHDLSYFFYSGASKEDFDILEDYLQIYYKSFSEFSKELGADPADLFSFEVLVNEWKENALFGVILGTWVWQLKLISKEEVKQFVSEHQGIKEEEQTKLWNEFLDKIYKSDLFRERTTPILIHAYEYGILRKDKL